MRVPPEPPSWPTETEAADAARALREELAKAKAKVREHREQIRAAGLSAPDHNEGPKAS